MDEPEGMVLGRLGAGGRGVSARERGGLNGGMEPCIGQGAGTSEWKKKRSADSPAP